ncbi:hypothetical protein ZEAMMB73_Zm00001d031946 [Zea mays]|uniref:Uncharacterized protein n=1 Tax=Zea mays TaxID=4577 RepID=A0A1D6KMK2_MAIZE|nr:hypothetical protein ZEAMMB73_Zm00001d031946 [Zea mays]
MEHLMDGEELAQQVKPLLTGTRHGLPSRRKGRGPCFLISHRTST